ncbi:MAG: serpin family protein [Bacteroidales bacterium]|nr:serpin family protein [Bacteroidales bacterium]
MNKTAFILIISTLIILSSCKTQQNKSDKTSISEQATKSDTLVIQGAEITLNLDTIIPKEPTLEERIIDFAHDFQKNIAPKQKANFVSSPVSLYLAMGMIYEGAKNNTLEEIQNTMNFPNSELFYEQISPYYNALLEMNTDTNMKMNIANKVYLENTFQILPKYQQNLNTHFKTNIEKVDFKNQFLKVETQINKWVEKETQNKIKQLLPKNTLTKETLMVLVNAIYLKAAWRYPFNESATTEKDFVINENETVKSKFMIQQKRGFKHLSNKRVAVLEMPYKTNNLSLLIILPKISNNEKINGWIPNQTEYQYYLDHLKYETVYMEIPKFKIESNFDLGEHLSSMGIKEAFTNFADFSGISGIKEAKIDKVIQKVFFEIDEKGTEAAAATAVVMVRTTSVSPNQETPVNFIANKPFVFILKENTNNTPLFMGTYSRP